MLYNVSRNFVIWSQWIDLDADGVPGLLSELTRGVWSYQHNESAANDIKPKFGPCTLLDLLPLINADLLFKDFDKNGALDTVYLDPYRWINGFSERSDGGWSNLTAFQSVQTFKAMERESGKLISWEWSARHYHFNQRYQKWRYKHSLALVAGQAPCAISISLIRKLGVKHSE